MDIAYNGSNQVASVTDTANPYRAFAHDDRGNVTNDGRYTFVYDHADQPTSVSDTGGTLAAYTYDGNKKRVKQVVNGKTSYFVYSAVTGGLIFKDDVTDTKATDYASIGPASVRIENGSTPVYTHADHLGSPVAATDAPGTLLWRESYLPFGEKLLSPAGNADNTGYTGHVEDAVTGLTYMQARYFDPIIGRFYSTDPIDYQDQLNLYAYVHNDPVNKTDPTGTCGAFILHCLGAAGGAVAGLVGEVVSVATGGEASVGGFAGAISGGAAAGVVFVQSGGNFAAAGAVAGAIDSTVRQAVDGTIANGGDVGKGIGSVNVAEVATETAVGAFAGKVPLPKVPGLNAGRGSITHVANTQKTMLIDQGRNISNTTAAKIAGAGAFGDTPEALAAAATGGLVDAVGDVASNATLGNAANCALGASGCE